MSDLLSDAMKLLDTKWQLIDEINTLKESLEYHKMLYEMERSNYKKLEEAYEELKRKYGQ